MGNLFENLVAWIPHMKIEMYNYLYYHAYILNICPLFGSPLQPFKKNRYSQSEVDGSARLTGIGFCQSLLKPAKAMS